MLVLKCLVGLHRTVDLLGFYSWGVGENCPPIKPTSKRMLGKNVTEYQTANKELVSAILTIHYNSVYNLSMSSYIHTHIGVYI